VSRGGSATPGVSVIIPAYNAELTIVQAVSSALNQTRDDLEVIVVDDGSAEPVARVLETLQDDRLRVLRMPANRGVSAARNAALAAARSPIVAQLDADDFWYPGHLERLLEEFADPLVGLAYSNADVIGHPRGIDRWIGESPTAGDRTPSVVGWRSSPADDLRELYRGNPIPAVGVAMRRDAARAVGGYPEWLTVGEEYALYIRLCKAGWRFAFVNERSTVYRWPEGERGATRVRRRNVREQAKLFTVLALQSPAEVAAWRRLALELAELVTIYLPATLTVWRRLRRVRGRRATVS
jgi:glycosyltransferase involved in cell wall biosynthesis